MQISGVAKVDNSVDAWIAEAQDKTAAFASKGSPLPADSSESTKIQGAVNQAEVSNIKTLYSATAGGKNYPATIAQSADVYVASVPNPPGARATGSSIEAAENNLQAKLNALA